MKTVHAFLLAVLMATSVVSTLARGKSIYTLVLEVQSYTAVSDGSYVTTGILTTPTGKFRCTLLDQKHYLIAGPHRARKIGQDRLRVTHSGTGTTNLANEETYCNTAVCIAGH